ncbi:condensation domain-containing protein, partial [Streptomyces sp. NPDC059037]|uniref:condensation domain-containing protein n=1 Tax=Streptomyces sp. NPDC059037 TaxID=3346710 RepID=UPI0036A85019
MSATLPLTTAQHGIWTGQQLAAPARFHVAAGFEVAGDLDPDLFDAAFRTVVAESEALRTRLHVQEGQQPRQSAGTLPPWSVPRVDLSRERTPLAAAVEWMRADVARPFDLTGGPLFRTAFLRLSATRVCWYLGCHHLAIDGLGGALFARRLGDVYAALEGGTPPGPAPSVTIGTLLDTEHAYRASPDFAADRDFWRARL